MWNNFNNKLNVGPIEQVQWHQNATSLDDCGLHKMGQWETLAEKAIQSWHLTI